MRKKELTGEGGRGYHFNILKNCISSLGVKRCEDKNTIKKIINEFEHRGMER